MRPDFGILSPEHKVVQFFADKVVVFLSFLILAFIVIDSFINLLPGSSHTNVRCFIAANSITSGQQSYIDAYCADKASKFLYVPPMIIFTHGLLTVLLHYSWYSMIMYAKSHSLPSKSSTSTERTTWLGLFYGLKNVSQILIALAAVIVAFLYEFSDVIPAFENDFNCTIAGKVDHWAGLDTVQCFCDALVLKDVFILFYGILSICIIVTATLGLCTFFCRQDIDSKHCVPSDSDIQTHCLEGWQLDDPPPVPPPPPGATT